VIQKTPKPRRQKPADAEQVFRQFAWNLAGTLGGAPPATHPPLPRPAPEKG
jgi:hypothetical protein